MVMKGCGSRSHCLFF